MRYKSKLIITIVLLLLSLHKPEIVSAQPTVNASPGGNVYDPKNPVTPIIIPDNYNLIDFEKIVQGMVKFGSAKYTDFISPSGFISQFLPLVYAITGLGLLVFLIIGGFSFLFSAGDPKKTEAAKNRITVAIVGFIIVITAYWVTQIVNYVLGLKGPF